MQPDFIARMSNTPTNIMMNGINTLNNSNADVGQFNKIFEQSVSNSSTQSSQGISYAAVENKAQAQSRISNVISTSVQVTGVIESNQLKSVKLTNLLERISEKLNIFSSHIFAQGRESGISENMHQQNVKNRQLSDTAKKHHENIGKLFDISQNIPWDTLSDSTKKDLYKLTDDISQLQIDFLTEVDQLKNQSPQQVQMALLQMEKDWTNLAMDTFRLIQMSDGEDEDSPNGSSSSGGSDYLYNSFIQQSNVLMNSTSQLINQNNTYLMGAVNGQDALNLAQANQMYQDYANTPYTPGSSELESLTRFKESL